MQFPLPLLSIVALIVQSREVTQNETSYLTNEIYRPLKHICEGVPPLCNFAAIEQLAITTRRRYNELISPFPLMAGQLRRCTTPDFRRMHRNLFALTCTTLRQTTVLVPARMDAEKFALEMDTLYMTRKNYLEMKRGDTTTVHIPFYEELRHFYRVPLTAILIHYAPVFGCIIRTPFGVHRVQHEVLSEWASKLVYNLTGSLGRQSGLYTYICSGIQHTDFITKNEERKIASVSIYVNFIREPKIFLDGQSSLVKHFAPNRTRGNFIVNIYTTTPLSSFEIRKPSGEPTEFLFALISYPTFEILAKYQVDLPQLDSEISGQYVISVTNEEGGMESQRITIIKAQKLSISVSPSALEVVEGFLAVFECSARGNLIGQMNWTKDYEPLTKEKYFFKTETFSSPAGQKLRLTLVDLRWNHSGHYLCTVSNEYEELQKRVELIVWPNETAFMALVFAPKLMEKLPDDSAVPISSLTTPPTLTYWDILLMMVLVIGSLLLTLLLIGVAIFCLVRYTIVLAKGDISRTITKKRNKTSTMSKRERSARK